VTAGAVVEVWDHARSEPISTFAWGSDTVTSARFNPVSARAHGWLCGVGGQPTCVGRFTD